MANKKGEGLLAHHIQHGHPTCIAKSRGRDLLWKFSHVMRHSDRRYEFYDFVSFYAILCAILVAVTNFMILYRFTPYCPLSVACVPAEVASITPRPRPASGKSFTVSEVF